MKGVNSFAAAQQQKPQMGPQGILNTFSSLYKLWPILGSTWLQFTWIVVPAFMFALLHTFGAYLWELYRPFDVGPWPTPGGAASNSTISSTSNRISIPTFTTVPQPSDKYGGSKLWCLQSVGPPAFYTWWGGAFSFSLVGPFNDMVSSELVMCVRPGDARAVIDYQIENFTDT